MRTTDTLLYFIIYSILGFYIERIFKKDRFPWYGPISPILGLFLTCTLLTPYKNIVWLLSTGIIFAYILKIFFKSIDKRIFPNIDILYFGLLNIVNFYILYPLINDVLNRTSFIGTNIILFVGLLGILLDVTLSLRRII